MLSASLKRSPEEALAILRSANRGASAADALEIPEGQLNFILYGANSKKNYKKFSIPKKRGGHRHITAPGKSINILHGKLLKILSPLYLAPKWVHGFVDGKGILTNAICHTKRKWVLNIDLEDFYGSINFGRVRGILQNKPWNFPDKVSSVLAQILTFENKLPQGARTSPLISNVIARSLDKNMISLAKKHKITYSRYADDLTFSSTLKSVPANIATWVGSNPFTGNLEPGNDIIKAVSDSGFKINSSKFRIQFPGTRQEVTGLTVNQFPNVSRDFVRKIRCIIHEWKVKGLCPAEKWYIANHAKKKPKIPDDKLNGQYLKNVVYGHIAYIKQIRGENDSIFLKLCSDMALIDNKPPEFIVLGKGKLNMFDFFLCHASEDKDAIARPIDEALKLLSVKSFIDENYIKLGDSFVKKINDAMGRSKYIVAIISTNSIKKSWPLAEINAAIAMDIANKKKIVPIMVGTKEEIDLFLTDLPLLSDRLYHPWDGDATKAAKALAGLLASP